MNDYSAKKTASEGAEESMSYTPRRGRKSSKARKGSGGKQKKIIIGIAAGLAALTLIFLALGAFLPKAAIMNGVCVNGMELGGMTEAEAAEALTAAELDEDIEFVVKCSEKSRVISAADIDFSVNSEETSKKAFEVGKSKNPFINSFYAVKALLADIDIGFVPEYDEEGLREELFALGTEINGNSQPNSYEIKDNLLILIPGIPGQSTNVDEAMAVFAAETAAGNYDDIEVTLEYADPEPFDSEALYEELTQAPRDAEYCLKDGEVAIVPEQPGIEVEKSDLKSAVARVNGGERTELEVTAIQPEKTAKMLEAALFSSKIGTYSTDFSSSSANRAENVRLAASSINNKILMPGDVFSYNEAIGNPSLANGYKLASVFENGKTSEGVGGGVCQVSSTLYSAVLYADLEVVERRNHSLTVGYVPKGQDATVAYGSIDFKFKNSTDYPIKVSSVVNGRKLTVSIVGTKYSPSREVKLNHQLVQTIEPTVTEKQDAALPVGTRNVVSTGKKGYVVDTYKTVYSGGQEISSKKITRSTYKMVPTEVTIGTGEAAADAAEPTMAPEETAAPSVDTEQTPSPEVQTPDTKQPDQAPVSENSEN